MVGVQAIPASSGITPGIHAGRLTTRIIPGIHAGRQTITPGMHAGERANRNGPTPSVLTSLLLTQLKPMFDYDGMRRQRIAGMLGREGGGNDNGNEGIILLCHGALAVY